MIVAEQNTPIGGNTNPYAQNSSDISSLIASIAMLTHNFRELETVIKDLQNNNSTINKNLIAGLKDVQKSMLSSSNNRGSYTGYKEETKKLEQQIKEEINRRKQLVKELEKSPDGFSDLNSKLREFNKSLLSDSKSFSTNFKSISQYSQDFSKILKGLSEEEARIRKDYATNLIKSALDLNVKQKRFLEIQTMSLENLDEAQLASLVQEEADLKRKIAQSEREHKLLADAYEEEVESLQRKKEFHSKEFEEMERAIQERQNATNRSNALMTESGKKFADRINRINDFFSPKNSKAYEEQYLLYTQEEERIQRTLDRLDESDSNADQQIKLWEDEAKKVTDELAEIAEELKNVESGSSKEQELKALQEDKIRKRKEYDERVAEHKLVKENNKKKKALCDEEKRNNADFKKSIDNSFKWGTNIVNVIGKGIETLVNREIELYKQAADTVFDSLESTQKQLGKTLKMSSGEYEELVDKLQAAAKEEGYAISSTQLLELASNLSDMGIRDENLLKSFAVSQAKASEAGVGSIFQMNEEFIKQYQRFYKETAATEGEEVAQEKLEKALGEWVAIEKKISDDYGSATALAQGGMTEIANYANELQKSNYLNQENSSMFMYGLANVAQAVEDNGGDFSLLLSDIKTITENPESELSASLLNAMETNREDFLQRLSEDPTQVISDYLSKLSNRYAGLDMTDLTYKMKAYGESMSATQMKALLNTSTGEISAVTQEGLDKAYDEISEGLSEGTYLTATEKLEKRNIQMAEDVAQIAQKVADGRYWMDNTLNAGQSLLSDFVSGFTSGLGRLLSGNLSGGLLGSGNTGTLAKGGVGDFLVGGKSTKMGVLGSELAGGAGIAYGEFTLLKDTIEGLRGGDGLFESIGEGFGDPEFSRGMGMALGGAIAGPVGAAVGGVVAEKAVPKIQEAFEDSLTAGLVDYSEKAYKRQQEAADELKQSAQDLTDSATAQLEAVNAARDEAKSYSTMQKEDWLKAHENELRQSGLLTEELDFADTESVQKAFDKYFDAYQTKVESGAKMELGRGELGEAVADNLAKYLSMAGIDVGGKTYTSLSDIMKAQESGELTTEQASAAMSQWNESVSTSDRASALDALIRSLGDSGEGELLLNQMNTEIDKVMSQSNFSGTRSDAAKIAWENLASDLGYTSEQSTGLKSAYNELAERKSRWEKDNANFQAKFKNAMEKAGSSDARDIREKYLDLYKDADKDLFDYVVMDPIAGDSGNNLYSHQETISTDSLPYLTTKRGAYTYETNGQWGEGFTDIPKFKTGLDYVPSDNYLALLHQGEAVLNSVEAQDYRENTTSFDSINNTLVAQTDRIENVLNKILTAVYSISNNNSSSLNPKIVSMVSGIATL